MRKTLLKNEPHSLGKPLDLPYLFFFLREKRYFTLLYFTLLSYPRFMYEYSMMKEKAIEKLGEIAVSNRFSTFIFYLYTNL